MKLSALLLCLPGLIHAAIWPDTIGAFKRVSAAPVQLTDRPIWDEYGLKESESARYENGSESFTANAYRLQDPTGAMAAFQWQRPAQSTASTLAPLASETSDSATLVHGNYVLSFSGRKPEPAELTALFQSLRNVDDSSLPPLAGYLPSQDLVPNSQRYITGPNALQKFDSAIPPSV